MKTTFKLSASLAFIFTLLFTSCVSVKKFHASEAKAEKLQNEYTNSQTELSSTIGKLDRCNLDVDKLTAEGLVIQDDYELALNDLKALTAESKITIADLRALSFESEMTIADQAQRLKNFQEIIQSQNDVMLNLKNSISDALINYSPEELYIYIKDGNVYVSLEEKLLFKSGSASIDPKGKEALKTLAQVLNNTKNVTVLIEGHTDNQPIKTNLFKDNWDLSTARANSIVRILTTDFGFVPIRITASGKSYFHPIKTNETPEGRASNRRTEVILSPDLKELYMLIYQ